MRLFRQRTVWWPTWPVWMLLFAVPLLTGFLWLHWVHTYLAADRRLPAEVLIVEGWVADYVITGAKAEFTSGHYDYLCASGGPLDRGNHLRSYGSYAELASQTLIELGVPREKLIVAPAAKTFRHRTFEGAKAARDRLLALRPGLKAVNVITEGAHARRTQTVFRKVFGPQVKVGVVSLPSQDYDPDRWWGSSEGVKVVVTEWLGYLYEACLDSGR